MKRVFCITSLLFVIFSQVLMAADKNDCWIVSDREIYVSGEQMLAKIFIPKDQSFRVVDLMLSSAQGKLVTQVHLRVNDHQADGSIYLPDSLQTGSYILTAYSPHFKRQAFFRKEVFVLNRFDQFDLGAVINRVTLNRDSIRTDWSLKVTGLGDRYKKRQEVSANLLIDPSFVEQLDGRLTVVVSEVQPGWNPQVEPMDPATDESILLTSYEGVVLRGLVKNKDTGEPVDGATVYLSKPDSVPYFDYYLTSVDGRFYFLLKDFTGTHSFVLKAEKEDLNDQLQIVTDEVMNSDGAHFNKDEVQLNDSLIACFNETVSLVTFRKIYETKHSNSSGKSYQPSYSFPFYGSPTERIDPDLYFDLPDFNEISKELLMFVRFRERNGEYSLSMIDRDLSKFFPGDPLILVDGIPAEVEQIASMGTGEIDWIDVVPYLQYYGNKRFNGILAIFTKDLDGSRIATSNRVLRLDVETLQEPIRFETATMADKHQPDFRQVLYWNPNVPLKSSIPVNFITSDIEGDFQLQIMGRKKDGELVQQVHNFSVSK